MPLATEPPASQLPSGVSWACPSGGYADVSLDGDGTFRQVVTGQPIQLIWPRGFRLVSVAGTVRLIARDGATVLESGKSRDDFGGADGHVCMVGVAVYPPVP